MKWSRLITAFVFLLALGILGWYLGERWSARWIAQRRIQAHLLGENYQRMSSLSRAIDDTSGFGKQDFYAAFETNRTLFSVTNIQTSIERVLKQSGAEEAITAQPYPFTDVWGHPFYIRVEGRTNYTNDVGGIVRGSVFSIISGGPSGRFESRATDSLAIGPFFLWQDGHY